MATYVDIYLLPVPKVNEDAYRDQASTFGVVAREHGALSYREFRAEDRGGSLTGTDAELLTAAIAEFTSREHRDEVMDRVMADPRVAPLLDGPELADMDRLRHGGFSTLVEA